MPKIAVSLILARKRDANGNLLLSGTVLYRIRTLRIGGDLNEEQQKSLSFRVLLARDLS